MNGSRRKSSIYQSHFDHDDIKHVEDRHENAILQSSSFEKEVLINEAAKNEVFEFADNKIITSKYTWWNFLFIFLYENFNPLVKFANFYFLCVAILECIPAISLTNGKPMSLGALSFVLLVEALTSIREDVNRHKADSVANNQLVEVFDKKEKQFKFIRQSDVRVGDIVRVCEGQSFPADLLFLRSEEDKSLRTCWINTKSLDGETDNKLRQAVKCTSELNGVPINGTMEELSKLQAKVQCELPNNMTTDFNGRIIYQSAAGAINEPLSIKNILLRGCILRNTKAIYGAVVSAGIDTKVEFVKDRAKWWQVNKTKGKTAMLTKRINKVIFMMVAVLIVMCSLGAFLESHFKVKIASWYIDLSGVTFWLSFFRFFLLCYQFIPVSLYVTMSVVYGIQSMLMENDLKLYDEVNDEPMRVRTSILNDDLGQVGYIFSDKTGTLTANLMQFRKCLVDGISYGLGESDIGRNLKRKQGLDVKVEQTPVVQPKGIFRYCKFEDGSETHPSHTFKEDLRQKDEHGEKLMNFLLNMAINHTVIRNELADGTVELNASSPDEQAFVSGSAFLGVEFLGMDFETNTVKLNVLGEMQEVRILHIIPYESSRKRMSVIVQLTNGSIMLFSKGADSIMFELHDPNINNTRLIENIACQVSSWAEEAFRTMVFGYKPLSDEEFIQWMSEYEIVSNDPTQKELKKMKQINRIDQLEFELENGLILQGASAIEDSLQEGVPETLEQLANAGIHIWMITGDKVGTAKNIAVACNLLKLPDMKLIEFTKEAVDEKLLAKGGNVEELTDRISPSSLQDVEWRMLEAEKKGDIEKANMILGEFETKHPGLLATRIHCEALASQILNKDPETQSHVYALVIDELFIDFLTLSCRQALLVVAQSCKAVIACRARKDQKAKLTRLVRNGNQEVVTLGIGDGANDVEMIRAAHIGVGIIGKEGTQAVNNADYAISQFRFLARLILVYGQRSYRGITLATLLTLYKNILFTFTQFFFTFLCGMSGTRNQSFLAVMMYNTIFTAFGPFYLGVFDRNITDENCYRFPQLHRQGIEHKLFGTSSFGWFALKSIFEAAVITFIPYLSFLAGDYTGGTIEVFSYGTLEVTVAILLANLTVSLVLSASSVISRSAAWISFALWIVGVLGISHMLGLMPYYYRLFDTLFADPLAYLVILLTAGVAILPYLMYKAIQLEWRPTLPNIIQDVQLLHASAEKLIEALEAREKKRALELELKTIKSLPTQTSMPKLLDVSEMTVKKMEQTIGERKHIGRKDSIGANPYDLMKTGNTQRSIRSIAGLRALTICQELHGPSYDAQSINSEAQLELISKINSHDWRLAQKQSFMTTLKTTFKEVSNVTAHTIKSLNSLEVIKEAQESPTVELVEPPPVLELSTEVVLEELEEITIEE